MRPRVGSADAPDAPDAFGPADQFAQVADSPFVSVADAPLSTFSVDVDTAGYGIVRRFVRQGQLPPAGAVRVEELVNAFDYAYPPPTNGHPLAVAADVVASPLHPERLLARVRLRAEDVDHNGRGPANLVFLIDTSGSMSGPGRLGLIQRSLPMLIDQLRPRRHDLDRHLRRHQRRPAAARRAAGTSTWPTRRSRG